MKVDRRRNETYVTTRPIRLMRPHAELLGFSVRAGAEARDGQARKSWAA